MNTIVITGNITNDPELRFTANGVPFCNFAIASRRTKKDVTGNRETDFLHVTCWRGLAEIVTKIVGKGSKVTVRGTVETSEYTAADGSWRRAFDVIAEDIEFLHIRGKEEVAEVEDDAALPFA